MADLQQSLLDLANKGLGEIEAIGREKYAAICSQSHEANTITTHDGRRVMFYEDRFKHAFFTSSNWAQHPTWKDKLDVPRIERIAWICEYIAGRAPGVECWEVDRQDGSLYPKMRVYLTWKPAYIVWLDELGDGFRFRYSSAYPTVTKRLRGYCKAGTKIWPTEKKAP